MAHLSVNKDAPSPRTVHSVSRILPTPFLGGLHHLYVMSMVPEKTIEECKRHVDECAALLERTSVPEYREAIIAMAKAWMKIAEQAKIKASR
jgi:hypothetical protein